MSIYLSKVGNNVEILDIGNQCFGLLIHACEKVFKFIFLLCRLCLFFSPWFILFMGLFALVYLTGLGSCFIFLTLSSHLLSIPTRLALSFYPCLNKNFNSLEEFDTYLY